MSNDQEPKARRILFFKGRARDLKSFLSKLQGADEQTLTEPSNTLPSPQKPMYAAPEIVPPLSPLKEGYEVALPGRRDRSRRESGNPSTEHRRPKYRGGNRFRMQKHVLYAVASVLILAGAYAQRDQIMKTAESAAQRVVDGMTNPPGLQVARERYLENQSYINYEKQLKAQGEAAKVDSVAKRASLDRRQIKDQIEFLITFAEGIDKTHGNNSAGDSHRLEAARLQALLDR